MVEKKGRRFDSHVNDYFFDSERDFLGKGELGTVVRAYKFADLESTPYALKIIRKSKLDKTFHKWVQREITIQQDLTKAFCKKSAARKSSSPQASIVKLHRVVENKKYIVMVMDLCEGGNLAEYLSEKEPEMRLPELEARDLIRQTLSVFKKIHALGYVHRDIKLDNLFLRKRTATLEGEIRVGDFGQAKQLSTCTKPRMMTFMGNQSSIPPDMVRSKLVSEEPYTGYTAKVDVY